MLDKYEVVIGLEVHAELNTETKIYCSCKNEFGAEVNTLCCPVCTGMPGTLPVLNEKVVEKAILAGHALGCKINLVSKQDRKNYFYPDLPKAYQISQFDVPLCENGHVDIWIDGKEKQIGVTRIHIEEDAGKMLHDDSFSGTLADFNRCGVPLIEIVSEPDMRSSAEAKAYLDALKLILQTINVSDCKMQEGSLRCDVNVSIMPKGSSEFGTRCEMKNINSFNGAVRAIEYEAQRQAEILEAGGIVEQQTRRWDDAKGVSVLLRSKEDAHDYRYFPEPDLKTISVDEKYSKKLLDSVPELPNIKKIRFIKQYSLPEFDAGVLCEDYSKADLFEKAVALNKASAKGISNWLIGDVSRIQNERNCSFTDLKITAEYISDLAAACENKTISSTSAKTVLETMIQTGEAPAVIIEKQGLAQISDESALAETVKQVLADNEKAVVDYKNGKTNVVGFLVGQCMRLSKGKGNPGMFQKLISEELNK